MTDKPPQLDSLFQAALEIESEEQRAAFLESACGTDSELRHQVQQLLRSHQQVGSFLEQPPAEYLATILSDAFTPDQAGALKAGLAATFAEDKAVVIGYVGHSVLKSFVQTMNLPRVALRDGAQGNEPIVRPKSLEMPDGKSDSRYQLHGEIARGGMGAILKGRDTDLGRDLAIKVLLDQHKNKPEVVQRFIEEAQIGGQLQHPGIVPVYELGQFGDQRPFFSMKLVKGETLGKLLADRAEPVTDRGKFLGIFEQICQTMAYTHSRGVIHRDLKPANIMVGAFGEVQVMDWGLAKVLPAGGVADEKKARDQQQSQSIIQTLRSKVGSDSPGTFGTVGSQTQMGSVMGTPAYMPPEQALGEIDNLDERADVFGLGAILCEILTGKPPYVGDDGTQVFRLASRGKLGECFRRLDACGADGELIALTKHCLELEPTDRPRHAGVLAERVAGYLESVETRLRETELERATAAARAEAEGKRAEAESKRAEAEGKRAESERRRLEQQQRSASKLRMMNAGLVVVLAIAVGTSIVAGQFWRAATVARHNAEQNADLASQNAKLAEKNELSAKQNESTAIAEASRANEQTRLAKVNLSKAEEARAEANRNQTLLKVERDQSRQRLYFAEMTLAGIAAETPAGLGRVGELLAHWGADADRPDLRGWEWYYLDSQSRNATQTLRGHVGRVGAVAYAPDGQRLATGGDDNTIRIWEAATGREIACLNGHTGSVNGVAWSPDGIRLASASTDGCAWIWDVTSGKVLRQLCGPGKRVTAIAWRPDGARVATTGYDSRVHVWDADSDRKVIGPQVGGSWAMAVAWSPDGKQLAVGSWGPNVKIIDAESGAEVASLPAMDVLGVSWSPASDQLATASWDRKVRVWDPKTAKVKAVFTGDGDFHAVCWSPDGKQIAAGGGNRAVQIWDVATGQARTVLRGNRSDIRAIAWRPDGTSVAATSEEGVTRVWDVRAGSAPAVVPEWAQNKFSPDGTQTAVVGQDHVVRISNTATGELLQSLDVIQGAPLQTRWSPDGTRIACSGFGWALAVWDARTGARVLLTEVTKSGRHFALAWSPSGDRIVTGNDLGLVCVWDPASGRKLSESTARTEVWDVAWSPDGRQIVSSGWDGLATVWDAASGAKVVTLRGHSGRVRSVGWSPDGKRIATGSSDRTVKLWDPVTGQETVTLRGHTNDVWLIRWYPDGCRLVTEGGNVLTWDATPAFLGERAATTLPGLADRIVRNPADTAARRLRAEVLARKGDWDAAASDFAELARQPGSAVAIYPAGWWALASPEDRPPAFPDAAPAHWFAPADDPNGFVSLPQNGMTAVCRIFAPESKTLALDINSDPLGRLWLNEQAINPAEHSPIVVELRKGWNTLAVRGGPSERFVRWRDLNKPADAARPD
ncbi:MAG: protein kinase [Planctomycetaceae bacterium]